MHPGLPLQAPDDHVRPTQAFLPFAPADIEQSLPERFEQQVRTYPGRLAVKTRHASYTYEALHKVSECVAHAILGQRGVGEEPIAVLFEHGAQMITALLGVLKAGKFYVPLNPVLPPERLRVMLHDSQATLIVTNNRQQVLAHTLAQQTCPVLNVHALDPHIAVPSPGRELSPDTLASLIYTSGSTGRPKGVLHNHRNVLHNIRNYTNTLHLSADDRHTLFFSTSFSASMMNIFGALLNGGALFPWDVRDEGMAPLASWLTQENITLYYSVVSVFRQFVSTLRHEEMFPALRLIHLGGEAVTK